MGTITAEHGVTLTLTSGSCGGRDGDKGQHFPLRFSVALIIGYYPASTEEKKGALGGVHRASPAQTDDDIGIRRTRELGASRDIGLRGIFVGGIVYNNIMQERCRRVKMPRCHNPGIGDDEGFSRYVFRKFRKRTRAMKNKLKVICHRESGVNELPKK